jgi:hypothetical protein
MTKQHQEDRSSRNGYAVKTLCGRVMPESSAEADSCERCAAVARARAERASKETP